MLVIQEWWGLVPHIKHVCDRFAAEGFVALAPDMYHGKTASEPDGAGKLFMALNIAQAEKDLRGASPTSWPSRPRAKIGAVGFCMGGQLALFAATLNSAVGACVNFYGIHPNVKPDYAKLAGPGARALRRAGRLRDAHGRPAGRRGHPEGGKASEIHVYPGVDHAFFNDERPDVYDRAAAEDAWRRTLTFFRQHLK